MPRALIEVEELSDIISLIRRYREPDAPTQGVPLSKEEKEIIECFILGLLFKEVVDSEEVDDLLHSIQLLEGLADLIRLKISSMIIREKITGVKAVDTTGTLLIHLSER